MPHGSQDSRLAVLSSGNKVLLQSRNSSLLTFCCEIPVLDGGPQNPGVPIMLSEVIINGFEELRYIAEWARKVLGTATF